MTDCLINDSQNTECSVDPWNVTGHVDYNKLINEFGCVEIDNALLERTLKVVLRRSNGKITQLHHLLKRNIFFAHRDFNNFLDAVEQDKPIYIYTGRGPSGGMHLGHLLPFMFTKWLQDAFDAHVVIQMTDDEKFLVRDMTIDQVEVALNENIKDVIAVGFNPDKTFIFANSKYVGVMYPLITSIDRLVNFNQLCHIFGFKDSDNIGKCGFPTIQAAPSFSLAFPHIFKGNRDVYCLIPQAIDQDPYFRMTRNIAPRLHLLKPSLLHSKFFPALQGLKGKMSSSDPNSAIFLSDNPTQIKTKILKHAFSGGRNTKDEQIEKGAILDIDVAYQLIFHFCPDDAIVEDVTVCYGFPGGKMLTKDVKMKAIEIVSNVLKQHQEARSLITPELVNKFTKFDPSLQSPFVSSKVQKKNK